MSKTYVQENDGFITASKLKCFLRNPEEYYLQYVKKMEIEEEEKRYFIVGNAFDDLISYGEEYFLNKYYIDEGMVKAELLQVAIDVGEIQPKVLQGRTLPMLRAYVYEKRGNQKIRITPAEGRDIMGMYREMKRQPLADIGSEYETQKEVVCTYKNLKLKGRLDRFSLEKRIIRDTKTAGRIDNFEYDMEETFDYVMSMAFYFILIKIQYKVDCDVILDVVSKSAPYQFIAYRLDKNKLLHKMADKVIPGLEALIKAYETDTWLPVNPLTGLQVSRAEMMKSAYYPFMTGSLQHDFQNPM